MSIPASLRQTALACAIALAFSHHVHSQTAQTPSASASEPTPTTLAPVVITAIPLGSRDVAAPVSVLAGDELVRRRGSSLGDTLNGMPGVSSSYFGPNANRPVVRGLDGDRLRVLSNAGASLDASSLSFDHAVPIDPLFVERIEVLRGPAALMYGGSAIGGAVNALDNRIPKDRIDGIGGAAEVRLGGAQAERGGAAMVETGDSRFALHADAFGRETSDQHVPTHTPIDNGNPLAPTRRVRNSASRGSGGSVGGSMFFDGGYAGLSLDTYDSRYGVVVEPDVAIRMKRDHLGAATEWKFASAPLQSVKAQFNSTRYGHEEIEGNGGVGTTFKTRGNELRIEAAHSPLGAWHGVLGTQLEDFDFSALGDEAFVPTTQTRRQALFALEKTDWVGGTLSAGTRLERARIASKGDADPSIPQFGPTTQRRFTTESASLSNVFKLTPQWSVSGSLSWTQRAPTSSELYAHGVHAATGVYERGDASLKSERGRNVDLAWQWDDGSSCWRTGVFNASFSRFISLEATGNDITAGNGIFPEYAFTPVRARLNGVEIDRRQRLMNQPTRLDLTAKIDFTRGMNRSTGEPLPRIAPLRSLIGLDASHDRWTGRIEWDHAARQTKVSAYDTRTDGYDTVNLSLSLRLQAARRESLWFVQVTNVTNELGYSAASVQTVRGLAPLPGRSVKAGMRVSF